MREYGCKSPVQTEHRERSVQMTEVNIVPLRPTYDGRQIRAFLIPFLMRVRAPNNIEWGRGEAEASKCLNIFVSNCSSINKMFITNQTIKFFDLSTCKNLIFFLATLGCSQICKGSILKNKELFFLCSAYFLLQDQHRSGKARRLFFQPNS